MLQQTQTLSDGPRTLTFPTRRRTGESREIALPIPTFAEPARVPLVEPAPRSELVSRVVNVVIASLALVAVTPIMALFAVLTKLTSRGPIFYSQTRVGVDRRRRYDRDAAYDRRLRDIGGRAFTIYKFRTMYVDAEKRSGAVWATKNDPRITPFGNFMRKMRIDELPQLLNVIKGDMNIVGPRPERPGIFSKLREDIAEYPMRQMAKPGITGWAQINHNYDTCLEDVKTKVRYDLEYIQRQSIREDLRIMLRTVPVMLFRKGAH
ncbi:MAG TPA: sugar transferase [Gemmatimonadaceae bacterium]|nr:sugar transferase [Gemmatimonadaceae bacterium]